jgi:hypothetical protein
MHERLKIFSFLSGHGETIVQLPHESHINNWLSTIQGKVFICYAIRKRAYRVGSSYHSLHLVVT